MGNKQSYENSKKILSINDTDLGVLVQIIDINHSHNENLKYLETKYSKLGSFTYFEISKKLKKIINNDVAFNITIFKKGTRSDKCVTIDRNYKVYHDNCIKKENVINKIRYYDHTPLQCKNIILRHDSKMNLVQIIVFGTKFTD
tara:strand:+ start:1208 stop:1639 length:432 start_codon:yes stop_codon:yes gene_type:complete